MHFHCHAGRVQYSPDHWCGSVPTWTSAPWQTHPASWLNPYTACCSSSLRPPGGPASIADRHASPPILSRISPSLRFIAQDRRGHLTAQPAPGRSSVSLCCLCNGLSESCSSTSCNLRVGAQVSRRNLDDEVCRNFEIRIRSA